MTTFAALGDSITLGVGDPAQGGGWRGWAALLADGLPGGRLVNLAANGARVPDGIVAGVWSARAEAALREVYAEPLAAGIPFLVTDPATAGPRRDQPPA